MPDSSRLPKSDARESFIPAAPFKYNPAERPLEDIEQTFVGRQEVLYRLVAALKEQSDAESLQHYLLLGPRGIGKTTLLLMLQKQIDTDSDLSLGWLPVRFGEEEFFVYTLRDLLALTLDYLAAEGRAEEAKQILEEVESEPDDKASLARAVDGLREISRKRRQRILLLIDNFDQIFPKKKSSIDARSLRKLLSTESFLMVIGSSVKLFEEVSAYDEAFFNFFSPVYIDDLDDSQIQELLSKLAQRDGNQAFLRNMKAQRDKIRAITFLTGGNPRLVMMLYEILSRQQFQPVVQALRATIDGLTPLFKDVMEGLSRQQAKILDAVMRSGGTATPAAIVEKVRLPLNAVTTQLGRLKQPRLLDLKGGGKGRAACYRVRDPMFRTWYQMRYLRPARRRIEMLVEFLQNWFAIEERTARVQSLKDDFQIAIEKGHFVQAREIAVSLEYFAASLDPSLLGYAADAYLALGDLREAALACGDTCDRYGKLAQNQIVAGYLALGQRLINKTASDKALESLSNAVQIEPRNAFARNGLGIALSMCGKSVEALREFDAVLKNTDAPIDQKAIAHYNRGVVRRELGDLEGELTEYSALIKLVEAPTALVVCALFNQWYAQTKQADQKGDFSLAELFSGPFKSRPMGTLQEICLEFIVTIAWRSTISDARVVLAGIQATGGPGLSARLAFLEPALQLAAEGDEFVLFGLAEQERKLTLQIAERIRRGALSTERRKLAKDYRAGIEDTKNLLKELEEGQLELLGDEDQ